MATYDTEKMRSERAKVTSRLRDFLVMVAFSVAALVAAVAFVQYKYAHRQDPASETAVQIAGDTARSQEQSARTLEQRSTQAINVRTQDLSEVRDGLDQTRGDLEAAVARINKLEDAVQKLQAVPARAPSAGPNTPAASGAELPTHANGTPTAQPASGHEGGASMKDTARVEGEDAVPTHGEQDRYVGMDGKVLQERPRPLPPPRKPASPRL